MNTEELWRLERLAAKIEYAEEQAGFIFRSDLRELWWDFPIVIEGLI